MYGASTCTLFKFDKKQRVGIKQDEHGPFLSLIKEKGWPQTRQCGVNLSKTDAGINLSKISTIREIFLSSCQCITCSWKKKNILLHQQLLRFANIPGSVHRKNYLYVEVDIVISSIKPYSIDLKVNLMSPI